MTPTRPGPHYDLDENPHPAIGTLGIQLLRGLGYDGDALAESDIRGPVENLIAQLQTDEVAVNEFGQVLVGVLRRAVERRTPAVQDLRRHFSGVCS